jgi:Transglutaminase-like superfamily
MSALRRVPPPPPPRRVSNGVTASNERTPTGIAARIASLQLDQVGRAKAPLAKPPPIPRRRDSEIPASQPDIPNGVANPAKPPPIPRRKPSVTVTEPDIHVNDALESESPDPSSPPPIPPKWTRPNPADLARALARRPPPPPVQVVHAQSSSPLRDVEPPRRRLPPMPTRLPTPPPEPEQEEQEIHEIGSGSYDEHTSCLKCRDFSHVDAHAALFPRHTVTSLHNLAYDLTEPFMYETEKVRAIFTWLHHNIAYDAESFLSGNLRSVSPEETLSSGLAVCDGYAGLFTFLLDFVGIQSQKVVGHGKGVGYAVTAPGQPVPPYSSGHAWNCVYMDGEWHLVDSCWGAGVLTGSTYEKRFAPLWFTCGPGEFGLRHFPEDPAYQFMSEEEGGPVSWEDYIMAQEGPTIFSDFYQLDLWASVIQPSTSYIEGGQWISFHIFKRCEHMSTAESDNFIYLISLADNTRVPMELNAEGGWSANVYIPKGGEVLLYSVTTIDGRDAKGIGMQAFKKALGRKAMAFGGLARWTVV